MPSGGPPARQQSTISMAAPGVWDEGRRTTLHPAAIEHLANLPLVAAVGIADGLAALPGIDPASVEIKWPNDILVGGAKCVGILIESERLPKVFSIQPKSKKAQVPPLFDFRYFADTDELERSLEADNEASSWDEQIRRVRLYGPCTIGVFITDILTSGA